MQCRSLVQADQWVSMSHLERHTLLQLGRFGLIAFRRNALGRHETRDTVVGSPQWIEHFSGIGSLRQTGALAVRFQTKLRIQRRPEVYLSTYAQNHQRCRKAEIRQPMTIQLKPKSSELNEHWLALSLRSNQSGEIGLPVSHSQGRPFLCLTKL